MTTPTPGRSLDRDALVLDFGRYRDERPDRRARMIPLRQQRRIRLGDMLALEFENTATLQYQVQEMLYVEYAGQATPTEAEVGEELEAYSRMLPTSYELCATLLIELDDPVQIKEELRRLTGIQDAVSLQVGADVVRGVELPGLDQTDEDVETVSVHVLRFPFTDTQRDAFRDPEVPAAMVIDHPEYSDEAPITGETRRSLLADLSLDTPGGW